MTLRHIIVIRILCRSLLPRHQMHENKRATNERDRPFKMAWKMFECERVSVCVCEWICAIILYGRVLHCCLDCTHHNNFITPHTKLLNLNSPSLSIAPSVSGVSSSWSSFTLTKSKSVKERANGISRKKYIYENSLLELFKFVSDKKRILFGKRPENL